MKTILGKKVGMTQIFTEKGESIPVTVVQAGPVAVTQVKTVETDGYAAVQIGFEDKKESRTNKPEKGHFAKAGVPAKKYLTEIRLADGEEYKLGDVITVADFAEGVKLDVTGTSKGKGTQGQIKRWHQRRGPMSHGSKHHRLPGGLAASTYPSRVFLGNKEAGRTGRETITIQNVVLVKVIADKNLMLLKGAVPGGKGSLLKIREAVKSQAAK